MQNQPITISNIRKVDANHQVVQVTGGGGDYCTKPCKDCPWRIDATGVFPAQAFRETAHVAYNMDGQTFGCHTTGSDQPATCAGFLLKQGYHNMAVRVRVIEGKLDLDKVSDGGVELYDNYREMAIANGVDPKDPVLKECRDDGAICPPKPSKS